MREALASDELVTGHDFVLIVASSSTLPERYVTEPVKVSQGRAGVRQASTDEGALETFRSLAEAVPMFEVGV